MSLASGFLIKAYDRLSEAGH